MTKKELENKIGMQIAFLLHSNKPVKDVIQHLTEIAERYANEKENTSCIPSSK